MDLGAGRCAGCRNDGDCQGSAPLCDAGNQVCVECTAARPSACSTAGKGMACLPDQTCGCNGDGDCGAADSGRICDGGRHLCAAGCRAQGGNGCPAGQVCSGAGAAPGTCMAAPPADMAMEPQPDMGKYQLSGGGLTCALGGRDMPATAGWALLGIVALLFRRRRRLLGQ
jgi:MYXO-CTERM domain-containing protein